MATFPDTLHVKICASGCDEDPEQLFRSINRSRGRESKTDADSEGDTMWSWQHEHVCAVETRRMRAFQGKVGELMDQRFAVVNPNIRNDAVAWPGLEQNEHPEELRSDVVDQHRCRDRDMKPGLCSGSDIDYGSTAFMHNLIHAIRCHHSQSIAVDPCCCLQCHTSSSWFTLDLPS